MTDLATPTSPWSDQTEDAIRSRMLDAIDPSFNRAPGDVIYDMMSPAAIEVARVYINMTTQVLQCFAPWATGTSLDAIAAALPGALTRLTDETDDAFRDRILIRLAAPVAAGSQADYLSWARAADPTIAVVSATSDGAGNISVLLANADRGELDPTAVSAAAAYISDRSPIGATVTVAGVDDANLVPVTVSATVIMKPGYSAVTASTEFLARCQAVFASLGFGQNVTEGHIIAAAVDTTGVQDLLSGYPLLNGSAGAVTVASDHLATLTSAALVTA